MNQAPPRSLPLTALAVGQAGVLEIADDEAVGLRIRELGFVSGTPVRVVRRGPLGDPVEVELRGYRICLRAADLVGLHVLRDPGVRDSRKSEES